MTKPSLLFYVGSNKYPVERRWLDIINNIHLYRTADFAKHKTDAPYY